MITALRIENYALIEKLSVDFTDGFAVITGETGAGKSILLGALGLVLGNRADLNSLKNKQEKCIIEAHFAIQNYALHDFFETNDLDYDPLTILRREILPSGKSRAFINDTPVNLNELQALGEALIDIHSQHETRALNDEVYQFQIIDTVAQLQPKVIQYQEELKAYQKAMQKEVALQQALNESLKEQDYHAFLWDELQAAQLEEGIQEELEMQLEKLGNVELIKDQIAKAVGITQSEQFGVLPQIKEIRAALQRIASFSNEYTQFYERVASVVIEMDDLSKELESSMESLHSDPVVLENVSQKLQQLYALQKKHQVTSVAELLQIQMDLKNKVSAVSDLEEALQEVQGQIARHKETLDTLATTLHEQRQAVIPVLLDKIEELLHQLGMPNARFQIDLKQQNQYYKNGKDAITFLFSANKGADFGLLRKVASGGELSRIMLAVKAVMAENSQLPTLILDEIDTGVSGEIAHKMGEIMRGMSHHMQLFAITHLPQIAGKGAVHYKVYKEIVADTTFSRLKQLTNEERIQEIAQMLSGNVITEAAMGQARELLN